MFKQISWIVSGILAVALLFGGAQAALAQGDEPPQTGIRWGGGHVTIIGADNFTVMGRLGHERVIYVDDASQFTDGDARPISFAALKVGDRVFGADELREDGKAYAVVVHVIPPPTHYKGVGVVTEVEDDAFHFVSRRGKLWEFYVDEATKYTDRAGNALSFEAVQAESRLFVAADLRADGEWWATEVRIGLGRPRPATTAPATVP